MELSWESRLAPLTRWMTPHFWGVQDMEIKRAALGIRSFGLLRGQLLFPDGTAVEFPGNALLEDRSFVDGWIEGGKPLPVYIGLRKWNPEGENVTVVKRGEPLADVATRFIVDADPEETRDLHAGGPAAYIKKLTYLLKVFWEPEKDHLGDYLLIPVAQLERRGADIGLDPRFIAPCLSGTGSDTLQRLIKDILDQLAARGRQLEEHKRQRGIQSAEFGSRDLVYLMALRSINRCVPLLRHLSETPQVHPWQLYGTLRQIVGDLSCFSETIDVLGEDPQAHEAALPAYEPLNLWNCFSTAQTRIVRLLDEITAGPDHTVKLDLAEGLYSAALKPDWLEGDHRYYLALTMEHEGKNTVDAMEGVAKLSSQGQIDQLIAHALPGIPLDYLSAVPQQLPRRGNVLYFAINTGDDQWSSIKKERHIAFSWDGAPADLQVDLMVVAR